MSKQYKGSLDLEWYNKQKSILLRETSAPAGKDDIPAPKINWINKDEALFYEIDETKGCGLTPYWVDRNDIRVKETRPLILKKAYKAVPKGKDIVGKPTGYKVVESDKDDPEIDNILIRGDNLLSLNTLKKMFDQKPEDKKVKCIYIDPPYNTGKAFEKYDDNLEHSEWLTLIRDRLGVLKNLLIEGGYIFVHLDDSEGPYGKLLLDEVFGRHNYVITIYIQVRYDVKTLKEDMDFNKLIEQVHVYRNLNNIKIQFNKEKVAYTDEKFNVKITELNDPSDVIKLGGKEVKIFKEGTYKIEKVEPSKSGLKEIWASGSILDGNSSGRFFRDYLTGKEKEYGYKVLYNVSNIGDDGLGYRYFTGPQKTGAIRGKYYQGMPLEKKNSESAFKYVPISNFIDLASYFGNCRHEGGVEFKSGKKPEILIQKLLEMATSPGDLILDCFGGSGSTYAVAHKMGRKWIGVEIGEHADTHILTRLNNVLSGKDKTGISKEWNWQGGGSFKYYHLGPSIIDIDENGKGDFNWSLGQKFIEESLLTSYDYILQKDIKILPTNLFDDDNRPAVGILNIGSKTLAAVCSLDQPDGDRELIDIDEVKIIYKTLKKKFSPEYLTIFTNRGVEMALDSKPDDLEIIKVPHAIFAELER